MIIMLMGIAFVSIWITRDLEILNLPINQTIRKVAEFITYSLAFALLIGFILYFFDLIPAWIQLQSETVDN